jgi:hypothetical protein
MAQKELRAYVSVDRAEITGVSVFSAPVATMGGIAMGVTFDTLTPPVGSPRMSTSSLPPATPTQQSHEAPALAAPQIAALNAGTMTLWVYGEIHYRDAFGSEHFTKYRFQIGGGVGIRDNRLAVCEEGNEEN